MGTNEGRQLLSLFDNNVHQFWNVNRQMLPGCIIQILGQENAIQHVFNENILYHGNKIISKEEYINKKTYSFKFQSNSIGYVLSKNAAFVHHRCYRVGASSSWVLFFSCSLQGYYLMLFLYTSPNVLLWPQHYHKF